MALDDSFIEMKFNDDGSFYFAWRGQILDYAQLVQEINSNGKEDFLISFAVHPKYWAIATEVKGELYRIAENRRRNFKREKSYKCAFTT